MLVVMLVFLLKEELGNMVSDFEHSYTLLFRVPHTYMHQYCEYAEYFYFQKNLPLP